ncbi:hypothetical protein TVAG_491900 [Trichomonas vaginalis G3]|uniref:DUF3447 domain-containing protein n=1 Tax=Trichomonas vaginalis (strain ATCC PRA-98 / G3) TaxID=412133 RepID=A2EAM1_TRIV3|nr:proteasome regulatory particle assembly [Trichomonas vaginalis G3]EAY10332.1 hypothetical protein TVAG_491900 [Trichomonas vaginalis G3]KAI5491048.1 proteasome regulatory particle assembly [Trichomonas vaginalis G3]|eukprot:XP_001322555.1 hypothetical protein [Trichomonas vaginalis G3]
MSTKYSKEDEEFMETYRKLFRISDNKGVDLAFNLINILIYKFKITTRDLIKSLLVAIDYNYRSLDLYIKIINRILSTYSVPQCYIKIMRFRLKLLKLELTVDSNNAYIIKYMNEQSNLSENELTNIIVYDQIDKFKQCDIQNSLEHTKIEIPKFLFTVIEACAYFGSVNIFYFIISNFDIKITARCLQFSFIGGNTDIINECLKKQKIDESCFRFIVESHNDQFLDYIFQRNLYVPEKDYYDSAIDSQNLKILYYMFEKDKNSIIPWCAYFQQSFEILKDENLNNLAIQRQSGLNRNIIHVAAIHNNTDLAKLILNYPNGKLINIDDQDGFENTALYYAVRYNNKEMAELLISHGANVNPKVNKYGLAILHVAAKFNCIDAIKLLISHGAIIDERDRDKKTALIYAAKNNCKETLEFLISHGADISATDDDKKTALDYAVENDFDEIIKLLGKDSSEDDISTKDLSENDISTKDLSENDISTKNLSENDISTKNLSENDISTKDLSEDDISTKDLSEDYISTKVSTEDNISTKVSTEDNISTKVSTEDNISLGSIIKSFWNRIFTK